MPAQIAVVSHEELREFFARHGKEWSYDPISSPDRMSQLDIELLPPVSPDAAITRLLFLSGGSQALYVVDPDLANEGAIDPDLTLSAEDATPELLERFFRDGTLSIAPTLDYASNGEFTVFRLYVPNPDEHLPDVEEQPPVQGPVLKSMSIANFKGIGSKVDVQFAPLTLLFGANSAGKSTIIHALHYAREILVRRNFDVDRTEIGGNQVELGGFKNLVHKHNDEGAVQLRFDLDLRGIDLPDYLPNRDDLLPDDAGILDSHVAIESATVEFHVWNDAGESPPYVCHYEVAINGRPLATIFQGWHDQAIDFHFEMDHPLIQPGEWFYADDEESEDEFDPGFGWLRYWPIDEWIKLQHRATENVWQGRIDTKITTDGDALPAWGRLLNIALPDLDFRHLEEVTGLHDDDEETRNRLVKIYEVIPLLFRDYLTRLILGPCEVLKNILTDFRYVGPIRETPPRSFSPPRFPEVGRWANGLGAWDALYRNPELRERVSEWMASADRLNTGYVVRERLFRELEESGPLMQAIISGRAYDDIDDIRKEFEKLPLVQQLILESGDTRLAPHDVGIGISQVIPVVAIALDLRNGAAAIEQPELHVHPAVQVGLGDLLIEAVKSSRNLFIIETHSEHLLLRLLRRIRETSEGELSEPRFSLTPEQIAVIYVENTAGVAGIRPLRVDQTGEFKDRWPKGFFDERAAELF